MTYGIFIRIMLAYWRHMGSWEAYVNMYLFYQTYGNNILQKSPYNRLILSYGTNKGLLLRIVWHVEIFIKLYQNMGLFERDIDGTIIILEWSHMTAHMEILLKWSHMTWKKFSYTHIFTHRTLSCTYGNILRWKAPICTMIFFK